MRRQKAILIFLLITIFVFCLIGCKNPSAAETSAAETTVAEESAAKELNIAYMIYHLGDPFVVEMSKGLEAAGKDLGINVILADGEGDIDNQLKQSESFVTQKVDAIVFMPTNMSGGNSIVLAANNAEIPIVLVCMRTENGELADGFCGADDIESGRLQGNHLVDILGPEGGDIGYIRGELGSSAEINRSTGLFEVLDKHPEIKIIADQPADWMMEKALQHTENWLVSGKKFDAILGQDDGCAIGAGQVISDEGLQSEVYVMGIDGTMIGLEAIQNGYLDATLFQDGYKMGYEAVEMAYNLATGGPLPEPKEDFLINPVENIIEFELVTEDNVDDFFKRLH